jgi:hypothetical protein
MQTVKISEIKVNPNNPRLIKDDKFKKLVQSVKDFPEMLKIRPIVVNKEMVILGGNMRYKASVEAGLKEIPIIIADLSESQQREFLIKDNTTGGQWDWDMLANEWDSEQLAEWGMDVWNPSDVNLDDFFEQNDNSENTENFKIILEYTENDFNDITELFKKHSGSKEEIVFKLLSK